MNYLEATESFAQRLQKENMAKSTIKSYRSVINRFLKYLMEQIIDILKYTDSDVLKYIEERYRNGLSKASLQKIVPAINSFSTFMNIPVGIKLKDLNFVQNVEERSKSVVVLSKEAQENMYTYASKVWKKRNICMMLLILETGIKLSELVSFNKDNLFKTNDKYYILVDSKFRRTLPISETLYSLIQTTINNRFDENKAFFVSNIGTRVADRSVIHAINRHGNLTSQILRDTYIYNLIEEDTDTYIITQLAGLNHSDTLIEKYFTRNVVFIDDFVEIPN